MEFTEAFSGGITRASNNGKLVSTLTQRDGGHLLTINIHSTLNGTVVKQLCFPIPTNPSPSSKERGRPALTLEKRIDWNKNSDILWSPNDKYFAIANTQACQVIVCSMDEKDEAPICMLTENRLLGIEWVLWAPDSKHILTVLNHRVP